MKCYCVVLLTLWPWPLTFEPKNSTTSRVSFTVPSLNTLGSFVFELCCGQTDRQTDSKIIPTPTEGIVKDWLIQSLDPLLDRNQFSCRRGRSTTHALIAIQHKWMEILDDRGSVRALFVDFRKNFDIINHNVLFSKLSNFNIQMVRFIPVTPLSTR